MISYIVSEPVLITISGWILWSVGLLIGKSLVLQYARLIAKKTSFSFDDMVVKQFRNIRAWVLIALSLWLSTRGIEWSMPQIKVGINGVFLAAIASQTIIISRILLDYIVSKYVDSSRQKGPINLLKVVISIIVWIFACLIFLSNNGVNITSLITGLGIGGIAVALAVQNILGDILSSLSIFFDKPFEVGDFIAIGEDKGTVEYIGIKTTRIQTFQGEQLIIPNKDITQARVSNFRKMNSRKVALNIAITYNTPIKKLKKIRDIVSKAGEKIEELEVKRVHLKSLSDSAIVFECMYALNTSDYGVYLDAREELYFHILESFEKNHIQFAYPTQSIKLEQIT